MSTQLQLLRHSSDALITAGRAEPEEVSQKSDPGLHGNMRLEVHLRVLEETWERATVWAVSSVTICRAGLCTVTQHA